MAEIDKPLYLVSIPKRGRGDAEGVRVLVNWVGAPAQDITKNVGWGLVVEQLPEIGGMSPVFEISAGTLHRTAKVLERVSGENPSETTWYLREQT